MPLLPLLQGCRRRNGRAAGVGIRARQNELPGPIIDSPAVALLEPLLIVPAKVSVLLDVAKEMEVLDVNSVFAVMLCEPVRSATEAVLVPLSRKKLAASPGLE